MKPASLTAASFRGYTPEARALAGQYLPLLRAMPLALLPAYLVQIEGAGSLFPVESARLRLQLEALAAKPELLRSFAAMEVPPELAETDWVRAPGRFEQAWSAALWQTGQIDAYHRAGAALFAALPAPPASARAPLLLAVMGAGARADGPPLFTRIRKQGLYLRRVRDAGAPDALPALAARRARGGPRYAHWFVDGGPAPWTGMPGVESLSWAELAPAREAVVREMDRAVRDGSGPERLAERLGSLDAHAVNLGTADPCIERLLLGLLTEGSGTQLYATSFVQAAGLALVRRAQPETLLLRFGPRRRSANLNDLLQQRAQSAELDADGALIDADMAVWYAWLAMRKSDARVRLLAWVESRKEAFVAGPGVVRGAESDTPSGLNDALAMLGEDSEAHSG